MFVSEADASIARRSETLPFTASASDLPRKWLDISVDGGVLVAYEEREPVFATLISPGRGGTPLPGIDPLETASTPTGTFRVDGKFKTATMVSSTDSNIVHSEVQYVQTSMARTPSTVLYWHDGWGEPKSGGCVTSRRSTRSACSTGPILQFPKDGTASARCARWAVRRPSSSTSRLSA